MMAVTFAGNVGAASGFFVPPEEDVHELTFMQWPVDPRVYYPRRYRREVQQVIADIANTVSAFEPVIMLMHEDHIKEARKLLSSDIEIWDIPTDDLWCRDAGPIFVVNDAGDLAVSHIEFNGWGRKQATPNDNHVAARVAARLSVPLHDTGLIGEGGSTEQSGHGVIIAHESSWVNNNRNPGLSRDEIEQRLLRAYGADRMVWAPGVWGEDITDYHIDSLARFTGPNRILMNLPNTPDMDDPFHFAAHKTHDILKAEGFEIEVIPEPEQQRVRSYDFVASYANYYACNGAIIAAEFGDPETDVVAAEALARHYPGRETVTLNVDALGELGGGIHCATQQMPKV